MIVLRRLAFLAALVSPALFAAHARFSDPVGIYAVVDRVIVEGDTANPSAIQVWGAFAVTDGKSGDEYLPAQVGYLYYAANPTNRAATLAEWRDLRSVAGSARAVGLGGRYMKNGRVRPATERPSVPDVYPLHIGLQKAPRAHLAIEIERNLLNTKRPSAPPVKTAVPPPSL